MEKNVKIIIGIVISLLGIIVLGSDYYLSLKHEVFDDMNKKYYEQNVVVDDLPDEIYDDQINSDDISENDDKPLSLISLASLSSCSVTRARYSSSALDFLPRCLGKGFTSSSSILGAGIANISVLAFARLFAAFVSRFFPSMPFTL